MTTQRRQTPRLRSLLGARALFNQKRATLDCVVRNISDGGALIVVPDTVLLPAEFELEIAQRQCCYRAHVRWRTGTHIGVSFESETVPETSSPAETDVAMRLRMAERDNARMKSRIQQLTEAG
ncbi:PilZ domain-containing protein [Bosea sp. (in: a-proteobacteria)]|uniref:PilZ domain-containing protein n=1 Tax=Bosea sp. (in: a-proteobacteria) TaxID=1871050 RepID=UPI0025BC7072|nr:PilZ domain-containing protein [Bosea sp. (in: a-proteobacteria)]